MEKTKRRSPPYLFISLVIALYAITLIWGVPCVHTKIIKDVDDERSSLQAGSMTFLDLTIQESIVPLPFIVIARYHFQVAPLAGWGGTEVYVWWFTGCTPLFSLCEYIS